MFIREGKTWELFDLGGEGGDQCHHGSDSHFWGWGEGSPPPHTGQPCPPVGIFLKTFNHYFQYLFLTLDSRSSSAKAQLQLNS